MRNRRSDKGFTMMEMLIAVAILVILMGVAFLAVINYQRSMKRLELDQTAREIFVATQNHLTMAQSQGLLEDIKAENRGYHDDGASASDYCLFVNGTDDFSTESVAEILDLLLPPLSLDDTVRMGGSYVIRYNWKTATVRDVFYSDHSSLSDATFSSGDYAKLFTSPGYAGDDATKSQMRLDGYDGNRDKILGWYGGADLQKAPVNELTAPSITIKNAEKLEVTIKLADLNISDTKIQLIMHGDTTEVDKIVKEFELADFIDDLTNPAATICLDDITTANGHFAEQEWCKGGEGKSIIPGENITLYARIYSNTVLVKEATSVRKHTNSLFGSVVDEKQVGSNPLSPDLVKTATIANIRHLENLYGAVSGYDPSKVGKDGKDGATSARQTSDLWWKGSSKGFCEKIASGIQGGDAEEVRVYKNGSTAKPAKSSFVPVSPDYAIKYYGQNHSISDISVDVDDTAGLFGTLKSSTVVRDLELINFDVKTSSGNAGALVGSGDGLTISNVVARNTVADDKDLEVVASGSSGCAGGLIGSATDTKIEECAAAVYVKSSASIAGGLVGKMEGNSSIKKSYAGGHTKDGEYSVSKTGAARINVQAKTHAGGLVGEATFDAGGSSSKVGIYNSYATTSARGDGNVGGLAGSIDGGNIVNCYATGRVVAGGADAKAGTFAGSLSNATTVTNGKYFSLVNYDSDAEANMEAVPDSDVDAITAFDADANAYDAFVNGTDKENEAAEAKPYDSTLKNTNEGKYPLKSVKQLSDDSIAGFVKTHYGDWPTPETLVVNTSK